MSNKFRFVGKIGLNALDARLPYKREGKTKDGNNYASFSCIVIPNKNNRGYCEVYGSVKDKIETFDNEGNKVSIPWSQRNDPEWLKKVAFYSQYSIKIGDEKHAFISDYDFVKFLCNNAEIIRDKTFIVTGNIAPNVYKGKVSQRFQIKNMIEADDAE